MARQRSLAAGVALALVVGVGRGGARAQTAPAGTQAQVVYRTGLLADLRSRTGTFASSRDVELDVTLTNLGPGDETIPLDVWENPVLAADVMALPALRRMPTVPPPVPPVHPRTATLHARDRRTFHWRLNVFSPELPPGLYRVYLRDQRIPQSAFTFTIAP